eukprot:15365351-Ditylum_brightwellii.AAC.2
MGFSKSFFLYGVCAAALGCCAGRLRPVVPFQPSSEQALHLGSDDDVTSAFDILHNEGDEGYVLEEVDLLEDADADGLILVDASEEGLSSTPGSFHRQLGTRITDVPRQRCDRRGEDDNEDCSGSQVVKISDVRVEKGQTLSIHLGRTYRPNDDLVWYCANSRETTQLNGNRYGTRGDYNMVEVKRRNDSREFEVFGYFCHANPTQNFATCPNDPYGEVKIKNERQGTTWCMAVNYDTYAPGGIEENIRFVSCNDDVSQTFLLFPKTSSGVTSFRLRPKESFLKGLDICVGEIDGQVRTVGCNSPSVIRISQEKITYGDDNNNKCISNTGSTTTASWLCSDFVKMDIISNSRLRMNVNGNTEPSDEVVYFPFSTSKKAEGEGYYLVRDQCDQATSIYLYGAVWVKMGLPSSGLNSGGNFILKRGALFQFSFFKRTNASVNIAICLLTRNGNKYCFTVAGADGSSDILQHNNNKYRIDLAEYEGEVTEIGLVQGNSDSKIGSSKFESISLIDAVDAIVRTIFVCTFTL